jgi:hypothetical protein
VDSRSARPPPGATSAAIDLLAVTTDDLDTAMTKIRLLAYAILDGILTPIDRVADQKPYCLRKHRRYGVKQVIADPAGRLVWTSAALPGSSHDQTAARTHGIIQALTAVMPPGPTSRPSRTCWELQRLPYR